VPLVDERQILQKVLNADEDRLKVEINATVTGGAVEVAIHDSTDSIQIGGGGPGPYLKVNSDGSINVNANGSLNVATSAVPVSNATVKSIYNEVLAVASGLTTQVVSYTVPVGKTSVLQLGAASGENIAKFILQINGVTQDIARTMFAGPFNIQFQFETGNTSGFLLNTGDVATIQVLHNRSYTGDFNGRLQVLEYS
jgi:hypothetical protein